MINHKTYHILWPLKKRVINIQGWVIRGIRSWLPILLVIENGTHRVNLRIHSLIKFTIDDIIFSPPTGKPPTSTDYIAWRQDQYRIGIGLYPRRRA